MIISMSVQMSKFVRVFVLARVLLLLSFYEFFKIHVHISSSIDSTLVVSSDNIDIGDTVYSQFGSINISIGTMVSGEQAV